VDKIYVFETLHDVLAMNKNLNEKNKVILLKYVKAFLEKEYSPNILLEKEEGIDHM